MELSRSGLAVAVLDPPDGTGGETDLPGLLEQFAVGPTEPIRIQADDAKAVCQFLLGEPASEADEDSDGADAQEPVACTALLGWDDGVVTSCDLFFEEPAALLAVLANAIPGLRIEVLRRAVTEAEERAFAAGETVLHEGAEADDLHVIISGQAEASRDGATVGTLDEGQIFGEAGLLTNAPRNATVTAASDLVTVSLQRKTVDELVASAPKVATHLEAIGRSRTPAALQTDLDAYVRELYGPITPAPCPFTEAEIAELSGTNEMLVYIPAGPTATEMCRMWDFKTSVDFDADKLIRYTMATEDQWIVASASPTPELIYKSGVRAGRVYEDEGLHGMDVRRYLAFAATFRLRFGVLPDQAYWTFLLGGRYDRSGISVIGFDVHDTLSHHGWMRDFKAKFVGSRYAVIAPRIEITPDTEQLPRAYRGGGRSGREADMD